MTKQNYGAESIEVLEGLKAVKLRPGMYIGNTGEQGLHHLVAEIVDNSIDEHLEGTCNQIDVVVTKDGAVSVTDNGRGIPYEKHPAKNIPTVRLIFTTLHAGGKFGGGGYKVSGGLHGVGSSVVNALSLFLEVEIKKDGYLIKDRYDDGGEPVVDLTTNGELPKKKLPEEEKNQTGTKVTFKPNAEIFETVVFDNEKICNSLKEKAYLNAGLTITFNDERTGFKKVYHEPEGITGLIEELTEDKPELSSVIKFTGTSNDIEVEVAFKYVLDSHESIVSYCNNIPTHQGGTHVTGIKSGLTRLMNNYVKDLNVQKDNFEGKDIRSGFVAVLSIKHLNPQYEGQTKTKLGNQDAKAAVEAVLIQEGQRALDLRIVELKAILAHIQKMSKIRKKEELAKIDLNSKEMKLANNGKLANCLSKNPELTELYIVEGDSAGGTAKQGRDRKFQAVLPLRGKILNVEKSTFDKIIGNNEIASIYSALGTGMGEDFDISKLNYSKIVILTDADVDGSHIRTLLLTMFYRYSKQLITDGYVFKGMPPLYKVFFSGKNKHQYVYSDMELKKLTSDATLKITRLQRYKGLGEMTAEQLWETTLNPEAGLKERIFIDSSFEADKTTNLLMGRVTGPRRKFIMTNSHKANI